MKYRAIYKVLGEAHIQNRIDHSGWCAARPSYLDSQRPLWLVVESKERGLRVWICHESGKMSITTANLNLPCDSREYSQSFQHYYCNTQKEMADTLRKLVLPQEGRCA